jgi:TPR repeat protein
MNALKNSLRTFVALITVLGCLSCIQGSAQVSDQEVMQFRKAAEQGYARSQNNLGVMYGNGTGVPQDYVLAYMWCNLAGASGDEHANRSRENLSKKMTPEQIAEAQKLSREWKPKGQ